MISTPAYRFLREPARQTLRDAGIRESLFITEWAIRNQANWPDDIFKRERGEQAILNGEEFYDFNAVASEAMQAHVSIVSDPDRYDPCACVNMEDVFAILNNYHVSEHVKAQAVAYLSRFIGAAMNSCPPPAYVGLWGAPRCDRQPPFLLSDWRKFGGIGSCGHVSNYWQTAAPEWGWNKDQNNTVKRLYPADRCRAWFRGTGQQYPHSEISLDHCREWGRMIAVRGIGGVIYSDERKTKWDIKPGVDPDEAPVGAQAAYEAFIVPRILAVKAGYDKEQSDGTED